MIGPLPDEARGALEKRAREARRARLVDATSRPRPRAPRFAAAAGARTSATTCSWRSRCSSQARAAGLAVRAEAVPDAIARTRWPGRLERVPGRPPLLLDGAHNPAGARALAAHLRGGPALRPRLRRDGGQGRRGLARALFPLAAEVVLTRPRDLARGAARTSSRAAAGRSRAGAPREPSVSRALALARRLARARGRGTVVVVAGSLYLVGAVKAMLERERLRRGLAARRPR